jgi:hypothetical protein
MYSLEWKILDLVKVNMQSTAFEGENQRIQGGKTVSIASPPVPHNHEGNTE